MSLLSLARRIPLYVFSPKPDLTGTASLPMCMLWDINADLKINKKGGGAGSASRIRKAKGATTVDMIANASILGIEYYVSMLATKRRI